MNDFFISSLFFGVLVSLGGYELGIFLKKKTGLAIMNPLLVSILLVIGILLLFPVDYGTYEAGGKYLSYLLTPATVCLAVPLYKQIHLLKQYRTAISLSVLAGTLTSLAGVLVLAVLFRLSHSIYVTLLPKSITTAIGMGISEKMGGIPAITVVSIVVTGICGAVLAEGVFKLLKIQEPVARGLAIGTGAHALGTSRAMELGEVEGAMSSLSIVVAGILTVAAVPVFAGLIP